MSLSKWTAVLFRPTQFLRKFARKRHPFSNLNLTVEKLEERRLLAVFSVTNIDDSGPGSLRQAILDSNATPELNTIAFDISPGGLQTIRPLSTLPTITRSVIIDGTTQPGYDGSPLIELRGNTARGNGLQVTAGNSTVKGLIINSFPGTGIELEGNGGNVIVGNFVGTDPSGTLSLANTVGLQIASCSNNTIGGTAKGERNLISGNGFAGVRILRGTAAADGNVVEGNLIGTDINGTSALPNIGDGLYFLDSSNNRIGGTTEGARNIISGNYDTGLEISGNSNLIQGNFIGTDITGKAAVSNRNGAGVNGNLNQVGGTSANARNIISGNQLDGIAIGGQNSQFQGNWVGVDSSGLVTLSNGTGAFGTAGLHVFGPNNTIGGTTPSAANVISGNAYYGVEIEGSGSLLQGNFIGTDATGNVAIGNAFGVSILDRGSNITIGGPSPGAGNLISGNGGGIGIQGSNCLVQGNLIGTDRTGVRALGNLHGGIGASFSNGGITIGGTQSGAGNLISGNGGDAVNISANRTVVQGNLIGTDLSGKVSLGNAGYGIFLSGNNLTVGGTVPGARNLISANAQGGVSLSSQGGSIVQGNLIGTDITGTSSLGNSANGLVVAGSATTVGGTQTAARNLISGNQAAGVVMGGTTLSTNYLLGNYIGVDITGTAPLGNGDGVVLITDSVVGGIAPGAGNLISGNRSSGIFCGLIQTDHLLIQGNLIGTDFTGTVALGNSIGVYIYHNSGFNIIVGGTQTGARNIISGNRNDGVYINQSQSNNQLLGNFIGTDISGRRALPNLGNGVASSQSTGVTIGGTNSGEGNLISGNTASGIFASGSIAQMKGNLIGTDVTGTMPLGNLNGIVLTGALNAIGGPTPQARNIISGNQENGIDIFGGSNLVQGNFIGTDQSGTTALGNGRFGIAINSGSRNTIGGSVSGFGNLISANGSDGVVLYTNANQLQGNLIGTTISGANPLGNNGSGLHLVGAGAANNLIGGTAAAMGNTIAFNADDGVLLDHGTGNTIRRNSIRSHDNGLGIALINYGNHYLKFPILASAISSSGTITIAGTHHGAPTTTFAIEFFVNSACNPSGFGEGETFLGTIDVTTDAAGRADFSAPFSVAVDPGRFVSATATDPAGNTSQFSRCAVVSGPGSPHMPWLGIVGFIPQKTALVETQQKSNISQSSLGMETKSNEGTSFFIAPPSIESTSNGPNLDLSSAERDLFFCSLPKTPLYEPSDAPFVGDLNNS